MGAAKSAEKGTNRRGRRVRGGKRIENPGVRSQKTE